jgi:hypothetical protein
MVLNTSFNIRGEPIVNTPAEALTCFLKTGMDVLFLGDYCVEKTADFMNEDPLKMQLYAAIADG